MSTNHNHNIFIALGSNIGDRAQHLVDAVRRIEMQLGLIIKVAGVYEVPAAGFNGGDFLNTCILVHSNKTALQAINILQQIEQDMGRVPRTGDVYEDRVIDLDIVLYDHQVIDTPHLQIPHSKMQDRNFVMQPLVDIAAKIEHPVLGKTMQEISNSLEQLENKVVVEIPLSRKRYPIQDLNFIAIEGNIGSGKTSLTHKLSEDFNAKQVLERFADNPFLPLFYEDKERYSFPLEMSFLADRYQQLSDDVAQQDLFKEFTVADYYVVKSLIFSKITLEKEEYSLYKRLFNMMYKELVKPDLYIYLYQTEDRLLENIKKRGREYEKNIEASYLSQIQQGYADFIRSQQELKVKVIDVSDLDFVNNQEDYLKVLELILED
ncbi:2-amino-4-hydroxy-6-hydroxymethyldihydropteridine diphosphokinase [uncultured Nonlabens sp.]|uniref:2-amino-4-hydroxy-6- hydroxymethyldihydropteridine diphosphokinase n=1 Tax=uncultured Nonlabens sp. TaxID=859306 RepID=UPI00262FCE10|nr:2-amino-4-hydroxy-6-hydroxymethyldihydropteridine diphosphokinase [uncultured Nonlabens sp.]